MTTGSCFYKLFYRLANLQLALAILSTCTVYSPFAFATDNITPSADATPWQRTTQPASDATRHFGINVDSIAMAQLSTQETAPPLNHDLLNRLLRLQATNTRLPVTGYNHAISPSSNQHAHTPLTQPASKPQTPSQPKPLTDTPNNKPLTPTSLETTPTTASVAVPTAPSNLQGDHSTQPSNPVGEILHFSLQNAHLGAGQYYDTLLGLITKVKAATYLGSDKQAAAIELNGGPRIARINATYALALPKQQRIKLTFERLDERLDYDFASGTVSRWDGQNAIGGSYAYLLHNPYVQSLSVSGDYTHSGSKDLSDAVVTDPVQNLNYLESRRVAGANSGNIHFDIATHPWPYARLTGGADYDTVHFDTIYDNNQNVHGFGGHARIEQRLWPSVKLTLSGQWQQTQTAYLADVSWLLPSPQGVQLELAGTTDYTNSLATGRRFYTNGLRLNANFGVADEKDKGIYPDLSEQSTHTSLLDWSRDPAVRMTEVLSVADSKTQAMFIACPDPKDITCAGSSCTAPDGWMGTTTGNGENISFSGATFSGAANCTYNDILLNNLALANSNAGENTGDNWTGSTNKRCLSSQANECHFIKTKL